MFYFEYVIELFKKDEFDKKMTFDHFININDLVCLQV